MTFTFASPDRARPLSYFVDFQGSVGEMLSERAVLENLKHPEALGSSGVVLAGVVVWS